MRPRRITGRTTIQAAIGIAIVHFLATFFSFLCLLGLAFSAMSSSSHPDPIWDAVAMSYFVLGFPGNIAIIHLGGLDAPKLVIFGCWAANSLLWGSALAMVLNLWSRSRPAQRLADWFHATYGPGSPPSPSSGSTAGELRPPRLRE